MRKTSAKTLSLALSLLLVISALFSLPFGVWAETEAVPGDLNGDKLVDANDVTILEAVLNGSQMPVADLGFYDISGNKMVDSEDLTVLKNMVSSENPALADKLNGSTTEDLIPLVTSVNGGSVQSAIAFGDSTRALELNGGTTTVLFAETQDWSTKAALEMDTLWLSGSDWTVNVVLLGADGETILGAPGEVTAQKNGWSRISVPLTGILAKVREKIGGIMITVANDAHLYVDNLALTAAEAEEDAGVLTRAEMENALTEMAWNWFFKGSAYQYDSTSLNSVTQHMNEPLAGYTGGKSRLTIFPTLENATSQSSVYTVCSGFAFDLYKTALGYPILGAKYNSLTMTFWRNSSYYPGNDRYAEGAYDMTVLRWHDKGQGNIYNDYDTEFSNYYKDGDNIVFNNWKDRDAVKVFFATDENGIPQNFRPGDIIVFDNPGHTVIYIGNGMIMHSNGEGKYNMETGAANREPNGTVTLQTFESYFYESNGTTTWLERRIDSYPEDGSGKLLYDDNGNPIIDEKTGLQKVEHNSIVVLRPLNLLTVDDNDGDPSNDQLNLNYVLNTGLLNIKLSNDKTTEVKTSGYGIDETTATRLQYPAMDIDRTVNITPYGTAVKGETITYSVKITNNSADTNYIAFRQMSGATYAGEDYEDLWVVEHIPEGTKLDTYTGNATLVGDTLRWNIDVLAGEAVELTYTVTVTGEIGDEIVSGGGWVNNIPSNTITNVIGGKKLSDADKTEIAGIDPTTISDITDGTELAEQIYKKVIAPELNLDLPKVQELMNIFFSEYKYTVPNGYYLSYNSSSNIIRYMYKLNAKSPTIEDKLYYDMLVPNYYGGIWCYTDEYNGEPRINELREEYLEVGDILVYMDLTDSTNNGATQQTRTVEGYTVLVYLGNSTFASVDQAGNVTTRNDAIAYTEAFKHDLFVCLRPSQSYEDLSGKGIPTYTIQWEDADGNVIEAATAEVPYREVPTKPDAPTKEGYTFAGWSPTVRPATSNITYKPVFKSFRDLSAGKLTDSELDALAAITPEMVQEAFAYYELTSVNLNYVAPWIYQQASISYDATDTSGTILSTYYTAQKFFTLSSKRWTPNTTVADPYATMLVDNTYGGTQMNDAPTFEIGYLQIGDIFCAAFDQAVTPAVKTVYYSYLYQGNGKFLLMDEDAAVCDLEEVLNKKYANTDCGWSYYFVIRPENYNSAKRDISLRNLTDAERYALSKLTPSQIKYPSYDIRACANKFYSLIGINNLFSSDESASNYSKNTQYTRNNLFTTTGARVPLAATTDAMRFTQKMAVPCYGGNYMKDRWFKLADAVENGTLQIGDIVAGGFTDTLDDGTEIKSQFTALYQGIDETGKGKFVMLYRDYTTDKDTYTGCYVEMYADEIDTWNRQYYFTLRPEMLAAETQDTYTVTWVDDDGTVLKKEKVTAYTLPSYGEDPVKTDAQYTYTFARWTPLTTTVNRDVTYTATYTQGEKKTYTVTWNNDDGTVLKTDENVPYGTVPTYDGDEPTKAATEQFTYTFAGWDKEISEVTGDVTYTAVFDANRFLTAHGLTVEEMDALASITPEDVKAALDSDDLAGSYLEVVAPWIYKQANIDISDTIIGSKSVHRAMVCMFRDTPLVPRTSSYSEDPETAVHYAAYIPMRVPNAYGGTMMADDTPEFDLDYLQVGDLLCASFYEIASDLDNVYHVYLYQGDGKFLLVSWDPDIYYWQDIKNKTYTHEGQKYNWSYYYVFRPENYNGAKRDISLRALNDAEKYALSQLEPGTTYDSRLLYGSMPSYYKAVGIDLTLPKDTDNSNMRQELALNKMFEMVDDVYVLREAGDDELMCYFQKMMVPCYGGAMAETLSIPDAIAGKVLKIGDVVAGVFKDADNHSLSFTALYQGGDKFLVIRGVWNTSTNEQSSEMLTMTASDIVKLEFTYYYTLRPENLATVSDEDTFTVTWVNEDGTVLETDKDVALYAHPSYDSDVVPTKAADAQYTYTFAGWTPVKSAVNSDITYTAVYSKTVNTYTVTWVNEDGTELEKDENVPYGTVPTYDSAEPTKAATEQFTYTFAGWDKEISEVTGDVTYTAVYTETVTTYTVTWKDTKGNVVATEEVPYGTTYATAPTKTVNGYTYTYGDAVETVVTADVAYTATSYVRDLTAHKLTDEEMAALAAITPEDVRGNISGNNLNDGGAWIYQQVGINYNAYYTGEEATGKTPGKVLSIYYNATEFFSGSTSKWTLRPSVAEPYTSMLVPNAYGGAYMTDAPEFDINCLQVGDLFCGMYTYPNAEGKLKNAYGIYLYQGEGENGEGKFLLLNKTTAATYTLEQVLSSTYTYNSVAYGLGCYYVIRPENYNGATRDISLRGLTGAEKYTLSKLIPEDFTDLDKVHLRTTIPTAYLEANIVLDLHDKTASDAFKLLFRKISGTSYYEPKPASTDAVTMHFQTMLTDCYGGTQFETGKKLSETELQIGDVFVGYIAYTAGNRYWSGIYQGENANGEDTFLMFYCDEANKFKIEVMTVSDVEDTSTYDFVFYFTLRPDNLAN